MIAIAGGVDVAGPAGAKSPEVAWERAGGAALPTSSSSCPAGCTSRSRGRRPRSTGERIAALGAERVFAVDAASTYSRPGPRLVDGIELLAHLLHPDLVEPPAGIAFAELD